VAKQAKQIQCFVVVVEIDFEKDELQKNLHSFNSTYLFWYIFLFLFKPTLYLLHLWF
jgi:hypothetical protein